MRMASRIWFPTVKTGLRLVIGSWKIIAMSLPRISCMRWSETPRRSWPSKRISPSGYSTGGLGLSCMMESEVTLLPLPDSPTIPNVSPGSRENDTPSTALTTPSWVLKCVLRLLTSSIATATRCPPPRSRPLLVKRRLQHSHDSGQLTQPARSTLLPHELEHRAVEVPSLLLALLKVFGADKGAQSVE